jgi:hypothetical protein
VILATGEVEIGGIMGQGQPGAKSWGVLDCVCHPSYVGSINRRIKVQAVLGIKGRPDLKNN